MGCAIRRNTRSRSPTRRKFILTHTSHHTRLDLDDVLAALRRNDWVIRRLITHRLSPEDAAAFYSRVAGGAEDVLGVLVAWGGGQATTDPRSS